MTPDQWRHLEDLFDQVLQKPVAEREAALAEMEAVLDDPALGKELRRLVEHAEPEAGFLEPVAALKSGAEANLQVDQRLDGRFRIVRYIGRGGMGEVYEAIDEKLGEPVAIKIIKPEYARDAALLERFHQEVQIARKVSHPNICRIHDLGEHDGLPYLSMELLSGETLKERLRRGTMPFQEWEDVARQLFEGLRAAHEAGVIHRDLKPANLMLCGSRLVILDFGLARPTLPTDGSMTHSGTLVGTLDWMAPEQLYGRYDERSDLYSAGLVLLHAMQGGPDASDSTGLVGALRRATGDTDFTGTIPKNLPAHWRYALSLCLERNPAHRPRNAQQVLAVLGGKPSLVLAAVRQGARTNWFKAAAAIAVLVSLLTFAYRYINYSPNQAGLEPGSVIMLAPTINTTGESRFDGITTVLRTDVAQSSEYNVWPETRLGGVLRSLRLDYDEALDSTVWREIAVREQVPLLVFSTLSAVGGEYLLAVNINEIGTEPSSSGQSWKKTFDATGPETLFDAEHEAANWIREIAGEEAVGIANNNREPQNITSRDWRALELFERAERTAIAGDDGVAIALMRRALESDPEFAMAHMRLGDLLNRQSDEEGHTHWQRAIELAEEQRLSQREKLSIESRYALEIGALDDAYPVLVEWVSLFPNDPLGHELLAACLFSLGQYADAVKSIQEQTRRFGPTEFGLSTQLKSYAALGQLSEAERLLPQLEELHSPVAYVMDARAMLADLRGDEASAKAVLREMIDRGEPTRSRGSRLLANLEADRGRVEDAMQILRTGIEQDRDSGLDSRAAVKMHGLAFLEMFTGRSAAAAAHAVEAAALSPTPNIIVPAVALLARMGRLDDARRLADSLMILPGPRFEAYNLRMQGELLAASGSPREAFEMLTRAARLERPRIPKEYEARIQEQTGQRETARRIYQEIEASPWVIWNAFDVDWPGVRLLARQYLNNASEVEE